MNRLALIFCVALAARLHAATYTAATGNPSDVQAAMDLATAEGDIVEIPAGTFGWTSGVSWTAPNNATLRGAGTAATGGGDQTVITDNYAANARIMLILGSGSFRMTGITVQSGTGSTKDNGTVAFAGTTSLRIDHCHFNASSSANFSMVVFYSGVFGVMDHCILDLIGTDALYFYNGRSGESDGVGNYEWAQPTAFGGANYFFIEDNIINGDVGAGAYSTRIFDGQSGSKVVVRFNTVSQAGLNEIHATGHAGNDRGARSMEIYGNAVTSSLEHDPNFTATDLSSGTALVWGNSWDQVYKHLYNFNVTRKNNDTYPQVATPNGWGYAGTAFNGVGSDWDGGTYNGTDTVLGYPCIDQPGRGQGDLLVGVHPNKLNNVYSTLRWPNQALEPIYIWANSGTVAVGWGDFPVRDISGGRVVSDRDYYMQASGIQTTSSSPFNGTTGTGWGTLANRPTTCTAGVAYFATDQGSWNTSTSNPYGVQQNGADGVLYVATATDTWTLYYTPYTYPHPLQAGAGPTATARVGNLRVGTANINPP